MLYLLDSNILVYSKMNVMPQHGPVAAWLEHTLSDGSNNVAVCETSILSFLRIATDPRVFDPPLPHKEASSFVTSLLNHRDVQVLGAAAQHFKDLTAFLQKNKFNGKMVMDAHLAVLALTTGAVLVTCDRDFKKIPYLKILDPTRT
jgi:toxin-antitoxin system PIN domain toxin